MIYNRKQGLIKYIYFCFLFSFNDLPHLVNNDTTTNLEHWGHNQQHNPNPYCSQISLLTLGSEIAGEVVDVVI